VDLALLDVVGPYSASIHDYDMETRTWTAVHASVSIENMPFHGDSASAWRCFKIYQADARGHIHVLVGKESLMSQLSCHEHVLRHLSTKQCVDKMVCVCVCVCVCRLLQTCVCLCVCVLCAARRCTLPPPRPGSHASSLQTHILVAPNRTSTLGCKARTG